MGIEIDAVEALKVEDDVLIEEMVQVGDSGHGSSAKRLVGWAANRDRAVAQAEGVKAARQGARRGSLYARSPAAQAPSPEGHTGPLARTCPSVSPSQATHSARRSEAKPH